MKSIKRGRGPSMMGAVGSLFAAAFGVIWTVGAFSMGAPPFFCLFGVVFVVLGVIEALYNFKNATGENRYSEFDIVEHGEEPDPMESYINKDKENLTPKGPYCPYCGNKVDEGYSFCPKCGRKL